MKYGERSRCKFRIIGVEQAGKNSSSFPWLKYISVVPSGQGAALSDTRGLAMVEQPVVLKFQTGVRIQTTGCMIEVRRKGPCGHLKSRWWGVDEPSRPGAT